jgi:hypothetical protein
MILARDFVWLHVPKTGGTWLRELVREHAPPEWHVQIVAEHLTAADIPPKCRDLPRIVAVRDPWDRCVSQFSFWRMHWTRRTGGYVLTREQWTEREQAWADRLGRTQTDDERAWYRATLPEFLPMANQTAEHARMLDGARVVHVIRFERLRESALEALEACTTVPDQLTNAIRSAPAQMTSEHGDSRTYYDAASRELVAQIEAPIVERYGYVY